MNKRPKLGQWGTVKAVLVRKQRVVSNDVTRKYWERVEIEPQRGLYIGHRTLHDGTRTWENEEVGYSFSPDGTHKIALVVFAPQLTPRRVLLEDFEVEVGS